MHRSPARIAEKTALSLTEKLLDMDLGGSPTEGSPVQRIRLKYSGRTEKLSRMQRNARSRLTLVVASGVCVFNAPANAADVDPCVYPKINVIVPRGPDWDGATDELSEHLRTLGNLDKCARVTVRPRGAGVVLEITTSDGRSATRQVDSVAALLRTAEALLEMPPPEPIQPAAKPSPLEVPPADPPPTRPPGASKHFELGAGGSVRFGGGPLYASGAVASFAEFVLDRWLLGVSARWDLTDAYVSQLTPGNFSMRSSAYGVSIGGSLRVWRKQRGRPIRPDHRIGARACG